MKTLVSVEEYLGSVYESDCDYVDGEVLERNMGERDHSKLQREFIVFFHSRRRLWKVFVYPEQRIQIGAARFRIPDVCVYVGKEPDEQIFRTPPFICIEILSPEDRMSRVEQRIDDFLKFGVRHVWVVDSQNRRAWTYTNEGRRDLTDGVFRTEDPTFEGPLVEIFAGLEA